MTATSIGMFETTEILPNNFCDKSTAKATPIPITIL